MYAGLQIEKKIDIYLYSCSNFCNQQSGSERQQALMSWEECGRLGLWLKRLSQSWFSFHQLNDIIVILWRIHYQSK